MMSPNAMEFNYLYEPLLGRNPLLGTTHNHHRHLWISSPSSQANTSMRSVPQQTFSQMISSSRFGIFLGKLWNPSALRLQENYERRHSASYSLAEEGCSPKSIFIDIKD